MEATLRELVFIGGPLIVAVVATLVARRRDAADRSDRPGRDAGLRLHPRGARLAPAPPRGTPLAAGRARRAGRAHGHRGERRDGGGVRDDRGVDAGVRRGPRLARRRRPVHGHLRLRLADRRGDRRRPAACAPPRAPLRPVAGGVRGRPDPAAVGLVDPRDAGRHAAGRRGDRTDVRHRLRAGRRSRAALHGDRGLRVDEHVADRRLRPGHGGRRPGHHRRRRHPRARRRGGRCVRRGERRRRPPRHAGHRAGAAA